MLWLLILAPLATGLAIALSPRRAAYGLALTGSLATVVALIAVLGGFDWAAPGDDPSYASSIAWLPGLGVSLTIGLDSVTALLVGLTVVLAPVCVLASRTAITEQQRTFYGWLMVLTGAMLGVFSARDLLLFYVCFEFTLLPMFVLISLFGSSNRAKAAVKFFLYTFTGSLVTLAGMVYVVWFAWQQTGEWTLSIPELLTIAPTMSFAEQGWVLAALLAGFAVKVPLFPVHTWLPLAHTEAPTAGSVVLAGVLLKLGTYGIYRFALGLTPDALVAAAPFIAGLAIVGIIYAGLICWVQQDIKKLVAYSSVSHLGFCVLGLVSLNATGLTGSVLYMLSHGFSTGGLFLMIGFMYERYHTRDMRRVGGLAKKMPIWATFMVFFAMASVGLPGLNGFPSELLCLLGTFTSDHHWLATGEPGAAGYTLGRWYAVIAGLGMIIAAIYLLYMVGLICFGPLREPEHDHDDDDHGPHLPVDLTAREITALVPMAAACIVFGLYPKALIEPMAPAIDSTLERLVEQAPPAPIETEPAEAAHAEAVLIQTTTELARR